MRDPKPFPLNKAGFPVCVQGNMNLVWEEGRWHLGKEEAQCRKKERTPDFDPDASDRDMKACASVCKVMRFNKESEKSAFRRQEIWDRARARAAEKIAMKEGKESIAIREGDMF